MHDLEKQLLEELQSSQQVLERFIQNRENLSLIYQSAVIMADSLKKGGKIISCGNGGSHCDAMHFAEELTGRYRENRPPYAAMAISEASHISCVGNDFGFDAIFSRYVKAHGRKGDVLLAISTSGNSQNVLRAAQVAKEAEMTVIALTGNSGGELAPLADVELRVPHEGYADRIQEIHIKIIHTLIFSIEKLME